MAAKKSLTKTKAKKILSDGKVKGKPLSPKQKKFFGTVAGGKAPTPTKKTATKAKGKSKK